MGLWFGLPECGPNKPFLTLTRLWTPRVRRSGVPAIGDQPFFKYHLRLCIFSKTIRFFFCPPNLWTFHLFRILWDKKRRNPQVWWRWPGHLHRFRAGHWLPHGLAGNIFHWIKLDESWMNPSKISENLIYIMSHHVFLRFFWHISESSHM